MGAALGRNDFSSDDEIFWKKKVAKIQIKLHFNGRLLLSSLGF
jgi:hypothetical protein